MVASCLEGQATIVKEICVYYWGNELPRLEITAIFVALLACLMLPACVVKSSHALMIYTLR